MQGKYKKLSHKKFVYYINEICNDLLNYISENEIKIDYICPVLRSGMVPATYISNKLNIIKFAPIQVKHISYKNGIDKIDMIFNPFNSIEVKKKEPVFLVIEAMHSTGESVEICINEIRNRYKNVKILYVCLTKQYDSINFKGKVIYEKCGFYYKGKNEFSKEKCKELNIEYYNPLFPWEDLQMELEHPDDLEENIFF